MPSFLRPMFFVQNDVGNCANIVSAIVIKGATLTAGEGASCVGGAIMTAGKQYFSSQKKEIIAA